MSIDLTEAIEAAMNCPRRPGSIVADLVAAAAPLIERQVRDAIAAEIEAARDWRANNFVGANSSAIYDVYSESARIAQGGAR